MSYLLAATDFSDTGSNSVRYACALASAHQLEVVVFHAFILPLVIADLPIPLLTYDEALVSAEDSLEELLESLRMEYPGVAIRGYVHYGELVDGIVEYSKIHQNPFLVLLGNSNEGEYTHWLDSHMMDVFRYQNIPVVAIPPEVSMHPVKRICFAWDGKGDGIEIALEQLGKLVHFFQAELHVVVANEDGRNQDNQVETDDASVNSLKQLNAKFHYLFNVPIEEEAGKYISENKIDWLVVIPHHYSFFASIFHRSHTKGIAHNVHIPLVALPDTNQ